VIPREKPHLEAAVQTHVGMKRLENEDRYAISAFEVSTTDPTPALLAIVADGVGGHRAGEVAAQLAVEAILDTITASGAGQPVLILQEAFLVANQVINKTAVAEPSYHGMSTTAACAWVIEDRLFIASVGDSRIYLGRGGIMTQLSTDHTWVQEAVESGVLTLEEARKHPNAHVIRRHLGSHDGVIPDLRMRLPNGESHVANQGLRLLPGDTLLLCSDGLTDLVGDGEILDAFQRNPLADALSEMVDLANARGGHDNITLIGLRSPPIKPPSPARRSRRKRTFLYVLSAILVMALIGAVVSGFLLSDRVQTSPTGTPAGRVAPVTLPTVVPTAISPAELIATERVPGASPSASQMIQNAEGGLSPIDEATYTPWPTSTPLP
jgi:PPM family protein phosphatase